MMRNAWKLDEAAKVYEKGWKGEEDKRTVKSPAPAGIGKSPLKRGQANITSIDNMLTIKPMPSAAKTYQDAQFKKSPIIERLRKILATRGARGILGLGRQFRIVDDDNSKDLDIKEFTKALKDYKVSLDEKEIKNLFEMFDKDKSGRLSYDEFLRSVRGEMNSFRQALVELAFKKLDKDGSGLIEVNDLKGVYNAKNHPAVRAGKMTEDQALGEFIETFEMHMNLGGGKHDQKITKEEFIEYYNNVSASIDDDKYFELMMVNAWKLYGEEQKKPAWAESYQKSRPLTASQSAPFGTSEEPTDYSTALRPKQQPAYEEVKAAGHPSWAKSPAKPSPAKLSPAKPTATGNYDEKQLVEMFRQALVSRGTRGLLSLQRAFKIIDDDNSKELNLNEFKKVIKEYRLKFSDADAEKLFNIFDRDHSGNINYDEFLRAVVGEMNPFRRQIVQKAFKILDKTGDGMVSQEDIKGTYSASKHPDVIAKKKSEEDVLTEFLDTFETHYSLNHPESRDAKITLDEFMEYYNNVSASIDDDKYFELMMTNAWNFNKVSYGKGWAAK